MRTVFFHWGLHPWACYAVVAMLLAYSHFRKGNPALLSHFSSETGWIRKR